MSFRRLWASLLPIGRNQQTGGYRRYTWTEADQQCRGWFRETAAARNMPVAPDGNGNLWAWWDGQDQPGSQGGTRSRRASRASRPRSGAIVTGSHLDSVPDGGAFDGPLGVVSGFAAIDLLRARGRVPVRPIAVTAFCEEEGARFGVACLGSKLLTGAITPKAARALRDADGVTWADAMAAAGYDPAGLGPDDPLLSGVVAFVELHIEQGRALADPPGAAIGVAEGIWPHGRWRFEFRGRADHAGTARLADRADPMLPYAATVLAARECAAKLGTLATFGKIVSEPGGVNAVPSSVRAWLDARAADDEGLSRTVSEVRAAAKHAAAAHDVILTVTAESAAPRVGFDAGLRDRVAGALAAAGLNAPVLPTGAGHDAGVLATRIPTAMLFVRNPTGVSHAPAEQAEPADCERGVEALAAVLDELACR
ncbi:MAG TPA: allantoate amidohydrolase [Streptosporangiaceae bacterium]|jgi:N-carbamoyl-L-amino-acid hydrolase|nr:allantoate amidohydrolase [Streptosporangiaceae bacterium]